MLSTTTSVDSWLNELSEKLNRPISELAQNKLSTLDFSHSKKVRLTFVDGSFTEYLYAFVCIKSDNSKFAVFTEHFGYLEFVFNSSIQITEIQETHYYHPDY